MDNQTIQQTLTFLARVDLKGGEAPIFMACIAALQALGVPEVDAES